MSDNTLIAAEVISAYVTNNSVLASDLPDVIRAVVAAFDNLGQTQVAQEPTPTLVPAVPVKKSVHHDYLVSLEDGKRYQTLKRHLSALGMSPDDYRARWGLAADYPMVARGYSEARSKLSKSLGLGKKKQVEPAEVPAAAKNARSKPKVRVEADAPSTAAESVQEPAGAIQEPAKAIQEAA